jgi:hypothetical protein
MPARVQGRLPGSQADRSPEDEVSTRGVRSGPGTSSIPGGGAGYARRQPR